MIRIFLSLLLIAFGSSVYGQKLEPRSNRIIRKELRRLIKESREPNQTDEDEVVWSKKIKPASYMEIGFESEEFLPFDLNRIIVLKIKQTHNCGEMFVVFDKEKLCLLEIVDMEPSFHDSNLQALIEDRFYSCKDFVSSMLP